MTFEASSYIRQAFNRADAVAMNDLLREQEEHIAKRGGVQWDGYADHYDADFLYANRIRRGETTSRLLEYYRRMGCKVRETIQLADKESLPEDIRSLGELSLATYVPCRGWRRLMPKNPARQMPLHPGKAMTAMLAVALLFLASCDHSHPVEHVGDHASSETNMMVEVEAHGDFFVYVDRETRVEYIVHHNVKSSYATTESMSVRLDQNGDPIIYEGEL